MLCFSYPQCGHLAEGSLWQPHDLFKKQSWNITSWAMKCGLSIMVPPTWLRGHLLLCQCVWPGYSAYHTVIETSYPVNTIFSSGRALAFIMSIHPRISCMSEKHELRKSRVSQCPSRESIESREVRVGFTPTSLPAEMGVHVLSRSPVLPAPSRALLLLSLLRIQSEPEYTSVFWTFEKQRCNVWF